MDTGDTLSELEKADVEETTSSPAVPTAPVPTSAWTAESLRDEDWRVRIPDAARRELDIIADALSDYDGPLDEIEPHGFDWPAMTELMADVRFRLTDGCGFVLLDRMAFERWSEKASRSMTWLLNSMVAPPIMQKWKGHRIYDVKDTGKKLAYGVRRSVTNLSQEFHTDGSFLKMTPDFLSLACIRQAATGVESLIASLVTAHNTLLAERPDLLKRLYEPFWWDRQAEHAPTERPANWLPVFHWDGNRLWSRYYDDYIPNGYRLMNEDIDPLGLEALAALREAVEASVNRVAFRLAPGQIIFGQNMNIVHGRTGFQDPAAKTEGGRLLLRYWLRVDGCIQLEGVPTEHQAA